MAERYEMVGYEDLQLALDTAECSSSGADAHGVLCGFIATHVADPRALWISYLREHSPENDDTLTLQEPFCDAMLQSSRAQLEDLEYGFTPLLPDDEHEIIARLEALSDWCSGFLYGFGLSGVDDLSVLSPEGRDFIHDLKEMSRIDTASGGDDEESEVAFMTLVEHIRVGVLLLYAELPTLPETGNQTNNVH